jgi:hypothetical protein
MFFVERTGKRQARHRLRRQGNAHHPFGRISLGCSDRSSPVSPAQPVMTVTGKSMIADLLAVYKAWGKPKQAYTE